MPDSELRFIQKLDLASFQVHCHSALFFLLLALIGTGTVLLAVNTQTDNTANQAPSRVLCID